MALHPRFLFRSIGIDLGTANTLIYVKGKGIVLKEPSVVALRRNKVLAVGEEAKRMIGRTPAEIVIVRPIKHGVIANFDIAKVMLQHFLSKIYRRRSILFPLDVVISVSLSATEIEKRAVLEALKQAGAKNAFLIENSLAGAMGVNLPVEENSANMIVDIGGGTSEAAVISLGGIVSKQSIRIGGDEMNEAIRNYLKKKYNFLVGEKTAEAIKINIGSALQTPEQQPMKIKGTDLVSRMPKVITVKPREIKESLSEFVALIINAVRKTLEDTPIELAADIMDKGIIMTGGGSLLKGVDKVIAGEVKMPVYVAENPYDSVALGLGKILSSINLLKKLKKVAVTPQPLL